jgi:DNA-binding MarR family transcriptional regulator
VRQPSPTPSVDPNAARLAERANEVEIASRAPLAISTRVSMDLPGAVSLTQLRALSAADELGPCTLGMLAEALLISTSSASRLVDRVAAAGLLDRRQSQASRREVTLEVTPRGRRLLQKYAAARQAAFVEVLRDMSERDARALVRGLRAVQRRLADRQA